jgi:hypothetical protein
MLRSEIARITPIIQVEALRAVSEKFLAVEERADFSS